MYYYLVNSLKRRLILELKDSFARHPIYSKITPFIQNRFSFKERPQFGLVIKGSNANKVQWSPDNFVGTVQSHVMLADVGQPSHPLEWVREDLKCIEKNDGMFPTVPGIYFIEILTVPTNPGEVGTFAIDPLITAEDEAVLRFQSGIEREAQLQQEPSPGTLRLWQDRNLLLIEGTDYNLLSEGKIELLKSFPATTELTADYRFPSDSIGPVEFRWNTADFRTIPGVVLAFGKRAKVEDKVAVVIYPERIDTAQAFGGKFEVAFDVDVIARDPTQMEEIADLVIMYLWGQKKPMLEFEGIEIMDVSMGGEAEDTYDETADLFYYTASMSIQLRADWETHLPLPLTISKVTPEGGGENNSGASGIQLASTELFFQTQTISTGRNNDFERIG